MEQKTHRPAVLISGASRGIGAAAARRFAQGGWNVAVNYCRSRGQAERLAQALEQTGVQAAGYVAGLCEFLRSLGLIDYVESETQER